MLADALKLRGLLPPRILTQEQQVQKVLENFRNKTLHDPTLNKGTAFSEEERDAGGATFRDARS